MGKINLNGTWALHYTDPSEDKISEFSQKGIAGLGIKAKVPGDVHLDLLNAGIIKEPLYGKNAELCKWVQEKDWWYSREFIVPRDFIKEKAELYFAGLDTSADIWLNGRKIGKHNDMFISYSFDVTGEIKEGKNLLVVRVDPGLRSVKNKVNEDRYPHISSLEKNSSFRMWLRKAQFSFKWDWAPYLLTCGIWREVELRSYKKLAIRNIFVCPDFQQGGKAKLSIFTEVENFFSREVSVILTYALQGEKKYSWEEEGKIQAGLNSIKKDLFIDKPVLWWPHPLGEPFLYSLQLKIIQVDNREIIDCKKEKFGIRKIELVQDPLGKEGKSFTVKVNGEKVFCKGTNWAPADSIVARVSRDKYRYLLESAKKAHINMFRIWGGGVYEDPYFYDLCDELGIMVWQDFMFACAFYPDDNPKFCEEVRHEANIVVKRLRNHPCLVLWCGNNENDWIYRRRVEAGQNLPTFYGGKIYHQILPDVCARLDPTRPYWPSSPYGGEDPNSEYWGDRHHWDVPINISDPIKRVDFSLWLKDKGKFISEYGTFSVSSLESLKKFIPPDELYIGSSAWRYHGNQFEKDTLNTALEFYFGCKVKDITLEDYILLTQFLQAETLKSSLEYFRQRKYRCSGALIWMHSDCWGTISSFSLIDYYLVKKPAFYFVKRAFEPTIITFQEGKKDELCLWIVNDTPKECRGQLEYGILNLANSKTIYTNVVQTIIPPNASLQVADLKLSPGTERKSLVFAYLKSNKQVLTSNRYFPTKFQFRKLKLPKIQTIRRQVKRISKDVFSLTLWTDKFVWGVCLNFPEEVELNDNYFDLFPHGRKEIMLRGKEEKVNQLKINTMNALMGKI